MILGANQHVRRSPQGRHRKPERLALVSAGVDGVLTAAIPMKDDERQEISMARLAAQYSAACCILHNAYLKRDDVLIPFVNTAAIAVELSLLCIAGSFISISPSPDDGTRLPGRAFDLIPVEVVDTLEFAFAHWSGHQAGTLKQRLALYWPLLRGARRVTVNLASDFPLDPLIDLVMFLEHCVHTTHLGQE